MIERSDRETRAFGMRRAEGRPDPSSPDRDAAIPDWDVAPRPPGPLAWAVRTAAVAGFAAIVATQSLVRLSGPGDGPATRVAQGERVSLADPETTGSIGRSAAPRPAEGMLAGAARATRLDPCALPGSARLRPEAGRARTERRPAEPPVRGADGDIRGASAPGSRAGSVRALPIDRPAPATPRD